ncbi:MAG: sarcosine oxidase subunit gamma family protein [Novosphingobium sp.]
MTDVTISVLPPAPLFALEIWGNGTAVAQRLEQVLGAKLPATGSSVQTATARLIRYEPTVWLVEGETAGLADALGPDGSLTAIGGGVVRVRLSGAGWRSLLMEHGVFDAESPEFAAGCSAATLIDQVNVRLLVESETSCLAFVPRSYAHDMLHFWQAASETLP